MKELSIEEKAKAYDKALAHAKLLLKIIGNATFGNLVLKNEFENMFHELAESEDERIKNEIIAFVEQSIHRGGGTPIPQEQENKWIAWLEKQGEQKSVAKYKVGDTIYYNSFGKLVSFVIANIVEDGTDNPMYEDKDGNSVFQNDIVEQKPWSEEDETTKNNISHIIRQYDKISKRENQPCYYVGDCLLWMQNIRDRVQPKQEWSQEDAKALNRISTILVDASEVKNWWKEYRLIERDEMTRLTDFLKSLKDRYTWKPSNEQMNALDSTLQYNQVSHNSFEYLNSLFNDLKKLREDKV